MPARPQVRHHGRNCGRAVVTSTSRSRRAAAARKVVSWLLLSPLQCPPQFPRTPGSQTTVQPAGRVRFLPCLRPPILMATRVAARPKLTQVFKQVPVPVPGARALGRAGRQRLSWTGTTSSVNECAVQWTAPPEASSLSRRSSCEVSMHGRLRACPRFLADAAHA